MMLHGGELIEKLRLHQLQPWLKQLSAKEKRKNTAKHQHRKAEEQIERADVFVVGRKDPATPTRWGMVIVGVMRVIVVV